MSKMTWSQGLTFGAGYDTVNGTAMQVGVKGEKAVPEAGGQEGDTALLLIPATEDFETALGINANVEGMAGLFGGSAKFDFKQRSKVSNQATFCMLRVFALNAYQQLLHPAFTDEAIDLMIKQGKERFRQRFGDQFVSGLYTGVEFYGSIRIESESIEKQLDIASDIQASYGLVASGKAGIDINEKYKGTKFEKSILTYQKGGQVNVCDTLEELFVLAQDALNRGRAGEAYPFGVELTPYSQLAMPDDKASYVDVQFARSVVKRLAAHMQALQSMGNDIDFVLRNQGWFEGVKVAELNTANAAISGEINTVKEKAEIAALYVDKAQDYAPNYPVFEMPVRKAGAPLPPQGQQPAIPNFEPPKPGGRFPDVIKPWDAPVDMKPPRRPIGG